MGFLTRAFLRQIVTATGIFAGMIFFGGSAFARGECRGPYLPCAGITDQFICQARPDCRWYELGFRIEPQDFLSSTRFSFSDTTGCRGIGGAADLDCEGAKTRVICENRRDENGLKWCEWYHDPRPNLAEVRIRNLCIRPLRVSVAAGSFGMSQPPTKFHEIAPGKTSDKLLTTELPSLYFYAETIDQPGLELYWGGNEIVQPIQGSETTYGFGQTLIRSNQLKDFLFDLNCDGTRPFHHMSLYWSNNGSYGVGLGNTATDAENRAMHFCSGDQPDSGCAEATYADGTSFNYLVITGGDGNGMAVGISEQQQTAINDAMNHCMRITTNCKIIGEFTN